MTKTVKAKAVSQWKFGVNTKNTLINYGVKKKKSHNMHGWDKE